MTIRNLTPHTQIIFTQEGEKISIQPEATPARVATSAEEVPPISHNGHTIRCVLEQFGEIENLPDSEPGTIYIVSSIVQAAAESQGRYDVYAPTEFQRDSEGNIIGANALKK